MKYIRQKKDWMIPMNQHLTLITIKFQLYWTSFDRDAAESNMALEFMKMSLRCEENILGRLEKTTTAISSGRVWSFQLS